MWVGCALIYFLAALAEYGQEEWLLRRETLETIDIWPLTNHMTDPRWRIWLWLWGGGRWGGQSWGKSWGGRRRWSRGGKSWRVRWSWGRRRGRGRLWGRGWRYQRSRRRRRRWWVQRRLWVWVLRRLWQLWLWGRRWRRRFWRGTRIINQIQMSFFSQIVVEINVKLPLVINQNSLKL